MLTLSSLSCNYFKGLNVSRNYLYLKNKKNECPQIGGVCLSVETGVDTRDLFY